MVGFSSVVLAAGLASISHAAPATRSTEGTFVPSIGYGTIDPSEMRIAAVDAPQPEVVSLTLDEFNAWAANATDLPEEAYVNPQHVAEADAQLEARVVGKDERFYQSSDKFPYGSVGRLYMPLGNNAYSWCSGTLVGPRLMAAARHCINSKAQYYEFSPGYKKKNVFPTAHVTKIISLVKDDKIGNCDLKNDWALYVLDKPLGTQRGYFKLGNYLTDEKDVSGKAKLSSAGYPGDRDGGQLLYMTDKRTTSRSQKDQCANGGPITGNSDTAGGMSGGPLWWPKDGSHYIYGTLFGAYLDGNGNDISTIHAHGDQFISGVKQLNKENPK